MKKTILIFSSLVFLLSIPQTGQAADDPNESQVGLIVKLQDGSKIIGTVNLDEMCLKSEAIGTIKIPIRKVRRIAFRDSQKAQRVFL